MKFSGRYIMSGFLEGLFDDPEESTKQLVEIVHKYAQSVPELLPSLRDVINSGILYEKKLKSFLDLLNRERKRQRLHSTEEGYETEYRASGSISACSKRSLSEDGPVRKKLKKSKKRKQTVEAHVGEPSTSVDHRVSDTSIEEVHPPMVSNPVYPLTVSNGIPHAEDHQTSGETMVDQNVIDSVPEDNNHICQPSTSAEAVVKSKKKSMKAAQGFHGNSFTPGTPTAGADHPTESNGTEDTHHIVNTLDQDGKVQIREERTTDETMINEHIIINTVVEDIDHIEAQPSTSLVSNTCHTPKITSDTDVELTPFRVIPSVRLMEDPNRFPDLLPPTSGSPDSSTSKLEAVSMEEGSTDALLCATPMRTLNIIDHQTSVTRDTHHQPGAGDALSLTSCNSNESSSAGLNGSDPPGRTSSSGASEPQTGPTTVPSRPIPMERSELSSNADERSSRASTTLPNNRLIRRLLEPSTVQWVMNQSCMNRDDRRLFKQWLKIQKLSLPPDSLDNGHVLFKSPKQWIPYFEEWKRFPRPAASEALHSSSNGGPQPSMDGLAIPGKSDDVEPGPSKSQPPQSSERLNGASLVEAFGAGPSMLLNISDSAPPSVQQEPPIRRRGRENTSFKSKQTRNASSREAQTGYFRRMRMGEHRRGSRATRRPGRHSPLRQRGHSSSRHQHNQALIGCAPPAVNRLADRSHAPPGRSHSPPFRRRDGYRRHHSPPGRSHAPPAMAAPQ